MLRLMSMVSFAALALLASPANAQEAPDELAPDLAVTQQQAEAVSRGMRAQIDRREPARPRDAWVADRERREAAERERRAQRDYDRRDDDRRDYDRRDSDRRDPWRDHRDRDRHGNGWGHSGWNNHGWNNSGWGNTGWNYPWAAGWSRPSGSYWNNNGWNGRWNDGWNNGYWGDGWNGPAVFRFLPFTNAVSFDRDDVWRFERWALVNYDRNRNGRLDGRERDFATRDISYRLDRDGSGRIGRDEWRDFQRWLSGWR
jgi:hypothetical protein